MWLLKQWKKWRTRKITEEDQEDQQGQRMRKENPYLPRLRQILEQVLTQRGLNYGTMRLLVIDTDWSAESFLEEDDVGKALELLSADLNFLMIWTDRPAYFEEYVETMYEETGLLAAVWEKGYSREIAANTVLDFEQKGSLWPMKLQESSIYLPIYKKNWQKSRETGENLDIYVPIGYNTVIVKGIKKEEGCL